MGKYQDNIAGDAVVAKARGTYQEEVKEDFNKVSATPSELAVPRIIFTDPSAASVGLSAKQAASKGIKAVARSIKMQGPETFLHAEGYNGWAQ